MSLNNVIYTFVGGLIGFDKTSQKFGHVWKNKSWDLKHWLIGTSVFYWKVNNVKSIQKASTEKWKSHAFQIILFTLQIKIAHLKKI